MAGVALAINLALLWAMLAVGQASTPTLAASRGSVLAVSPTTTCPAGTAAITSSVFLINGKIAPLTNVQSGDSVQVFFKIAPGCAGVQVSLATYKALNAVFSLGNLLSQTLYQSATGTFNAGGYYRLGPVAVPPCYFQLDFVRGPVVQQFTVGSSYAGRLIAGRLAGSTPCLTTPTPTTVPTQTPVPTNTPTSTATATNTPAPTVTATATTNPAPCAGIFSPGYYGNKGGGGYFAHHTTADFAQLVAGTQDFGYLVVRNPDSSINVAATVTNAEAILQNTAGPSAEYLRHLLTSELNVVSTPALLQESYQGQTVSTLLQQAYANRSNPDASSVYYQFVFYLGGGGETGACQLS